MSKKYTYIKENEENFSHLKLKLNTSYDVFDANDSQKLNTDFHYIIMNINQNPRLSSTFFKKEWLDEYFIDTVEYRKQKIRNALNG